MHTKSTTSRLVLPAMCAAFFVVVLDTTALTVALPAVGTSFHADLSGLQWVANAYTVAFAGFLLTAGRWHDHFGARRGLFIGALAFGLLSLLCGCAPGLIALCVFRFLQGIAAALVMTGSWAMAAHTYPEPAVRARVFGIVSVMGTVGLFGGPVIGGLLTDFVGWRWIFLVNPLVSALIVLALRTSSDDERHATISFDIVGQVLSVCTLGGLALFLLEGSDNGWTSLLCLIGLAATILTAVAFVVAERSQTNPMLPPQLFADRAFVVATLASGAVTFVMYGHIFFFSLWFQSNQHLSAREASIALLPLTVAPIVTNLVTARYLAHVNPWKAATVAFCFLFTGCALLVASGGNHQWGRDVAMVIMGLGGGLGVPALVQASIARAPKALFGIASGTVNVNRQIGILAGVALLGGLVDHENAARISGIIGLAVSAVALTATATTTRR